jgi:hypothetical protein
MLAAVVARFTRRENTGDVVTMFMFFFNSRALIMLIGLRAQFSQGRRGNTGEQESSRSMYYPWSIIKSWFTLIICIDKKALPR